MKNSLLALVLLLSPLAAPAETGALPPFAFAGLSALRADISTLETPAPRPADVIAKNHLLIQAGKDALFGYAETPAQFGEAAAYWTQILTAAGIQAGIPTYDKGFFTLPYRTADGRALRSFLAEPRQFPPKDEAGLRANMALAAASLSAAGLTPVSARVVDLDLILPTYSILYLAKPEAHLARETQLRVLNPGGDIDKDLIKASGVTVVQTPEPWLLVYVGPELGYVGLWAKTPQDLALKLERRKAFLIGEGKRIVGEKLAPINDAEYKFGAELMFFQ